MQHNESNIQIVCVRWFRQHYPKYATLMFSVPNGGYRHIQTAIRMHNEGMTAGVSDLILLMPSGDGVFHSLCIEMKTLAKTSKQSTAQKDWQKQIEQVGNCYKVVHCFEEFVHVVRAYIGEKRTDNLSKGYGITNRN